MGGVSVADLRIYVFSFNRGAFLENCLRSIYLCAPECDVVVMDDRSSDRATQDVLRSASRTVRVVVAGAPGDLELKTGGLVGNMGSALGAARDDGIQYVLFLQDDMQLVRALTDDDLVRAQRFFRANRNSAQLQTCFMKRLFAEQDERLTVIDDSGTAYLRPGGCTGHSGFSAVGLFEVARFFERLGGLKRNESSTNAYAERNDIHMGLSATPFMMWLPYPMSHRGRKRNIPLRIVERLGGCGYYPYRMMNSAEVAALLTRDIRRRPYAEEWLSARGLPDARVWSFGGGTSNLIARGGVRGWLGRTLSGARKVADLGPAGC